VTRGENAGEDLRHAAVVRSMRKIGEAKADGETSFTGDANVPLPKEWKRENLRAVAFVQEKKSRRILGAAEISHRALNLEDFVLILRFDREAACIPGIEFSQVLSISNAGKNYSARRSFPSINLRQFVVKRANVETTGASDSNTRRGHFLEVIVGRPNHYRILSQHPIPGSASRRNPQ